MQEYNALSVHSGSSVCTSHARAHDSSNVDARVVLRLVRTSSSSYSARCCVARAMGVAVSRSPMTAQLGEEIVRLSVVIRASNSLQLRRRVARIRSHWRSHRIGLDSRAELIFVSDRSRQASESKCRSRTEQQQLCRSNCSCSRVAPACELRHSSQQLYTARSSLQVSPIDRCCALQWSSLGSRSWPSIALVRFRFRSLAMMVAVAAASGGGVGASTSTTSEDDAEPPRCRLARLDRALSLETPLLPPLVDMSAESAQRILRSCSACPRMHIRAALTLCPCGLSASCRICPQTASPSLTAPSRACTSSLSSSRPADGPPPRGVLTVRHRRQAFLCPRPFR